MTTSSESLLATPTHLTGHYTVTSPELFIQLYMLRFIPEHTRPTQTISRIKACPRSHQDPPLQPTQNDPVESKPQFTKVVAQQPQPGPLHITSKNSHSKANAHDPTRYQRPQDHVPSEDWPQSCLRSSRPQDNTKGKGAPYLHRRRSTSPAPERATSKSRQLTAHNTTHSPGGS